MKAYRLTTRTFYQLYNFVPAGTITAGYDTETGDVLFFFHSSFLKQYKPHRDAFIKDFKSNLEDYGFEIVEEKVLTAGTYRRIHYNSVCYRIRRGF